MPNHKTQKFSYFHNSNHFQLSTVQINITVGRVVMGSPPKRLRTESPDGPGGFSRSDIAVIGIAGRFPGRGENPELLWKMLQAGESAWTEIPTRRFNINGFYHPNPSRQGSVSGNHRPSRTRVDHNCLRFPFAVVISCPVMVPISTPL